MNNLSADNYVDSDIKELEIVEEDSNLITKLNTPLNILLLTLNFIVLAAIVVVLIVF